MMAKLISVLLILLVLVFAGPVTGQDDAAGRLDEADAAYQAKDYSRAEQLYESLLESGYRDAGIYYNLGNSYYRLGQQGLAVLNYERGLLLAPHDKDLLHNLAVVRSELPDNLEVIPPFFLKRWWETLVRGLPSGGWATLGLIFLWAGLAGFGFWITGRTRKFKVWGFFLGLILVFLAIPAFTLSFARKAMELDSGKAVIISNEITLRSAPDPESSPILALHGGTTVELLDAIGDWHKVLLSNGDQGWLPASAVEEVSEGLSAENDH